MRHDTSQSGRDATERQLMRYLWALERGDFDGVANVFAAAAENVELDRLIVEVNRTLHEEEGLSPLTADAEVVHTLLRRFLPSGFPGEAEELGVSVGEIAAKLARDRQLSTVDRDLGRRLAQSEMPVPSALNREAVRRLATALGIDGSDAFWRRFRDAAIMAWMGRGHQKTQLAATRRVGASAWETLPSCGIESPAAPYSSGLSEVDPIAATRRVYANAGWDIDQAEAAIAPLDDLIAAYSIRVAELPDLTYRRAAEFLAAETGQLISVPQRSTETLAGFLFCLIEGDALLGCVLINQRDRIERRRFSIAHELGHYVMHFLPQLARSGVESGVTMLWEGLTYAGDADVPAGTMEGSHEVPTVGPQSVLLSGNWREEDANRFAAELLMPAAACRAAVERHRRRFRGMSHVRLMATEFLVSKEAMRRRLQDLDLDSENRSDGRG